MIARFFGKIALIIVLLFVVLIAPVAINTTSAKQPFTLEAIHQSIQSRYSPVAHMSPAQLQTALETDEKNFLVLDARETDEFTVSHIKGARRVNPSIWHGPFMSKFGDMARGKTVVIYCSVGERSSKLAKYVQQALLQKGATGVYNLQGGIFKWHNERRTLLNNHKSPTSFVHPYNKHWGQLVQRTNQLRTSPKVRP